MDHIRYRFNLFEGRRPFDSFSQSSLFLTMYYNCLMTYLFTNSNLRTFPAYLQLRYELHWDMAPIHEMTH